MAHDRDERVVQFGWDGHRFRTELGRHRAHFRERLGVGVPGGREDPGGSEEQVGARAVEALLLRARHRVPTDEARGAVGARVLDRGDDRVLHRTDVGDGARARVERFDHDVGDLSDGDRDDDKIGSGDRFGDTRGECVDRTRFLRAYGTRGVVVVADNLDTETP